MIACSMKEKIMHFILITLFVGFFAIISAAILFQQKAYSRIASLLYSFFVEILNAD